jgi:hypothetical protein
MRTQDRKSQKKVLIAAEFKKKRNSKHHSQRALTPDEFEIYNEYEDIDALDEFFSDPENREDFLD